MEDRLVRIPLPTDLLRRIDNLLGDRVGGYSDRTEFIRDALEERVLELTHSPLDEASGPRSRAQLGAGSGGGTVDKVAALGAWVRELDERQPPGDPDNEWDVPIPSIDFEPRNIEQTALRLEGRGVFRSLPIALPIEDGPLYGLHSRDYPSLWALNRLCSWTLERPLRLQDFHDLAVRAAWSFGVGLVSLGGELGVNLAGLFPTNRHRASSAEETFRAFGIGLVRKPRSGPSPVLSGPLFKWQVCDVWPVDDELMIAPTSAGHELLQAIDGLTADPPHEADRARGFLAYLSAQAPQDRECFDELLRAAAEAPARDALVRHFREPWHQMSESMRETTVQGYVGRAREWGLLRPKLERGRYRLDELGEELLAGIT